MRSRTTKRSAHAAGGVLWPVLVVAVGQTPKMPHTSLTAMCAPLTTHVRHRRTQWLLQRKRPLMLALGMTQTDELLGKPAAVLNAVAAGKLPGRVALTRLDRLVENGELSPAAHGAVCALLDPF